MNEIFKKTTNTVKVSKNAIRTSIPASIQDFLNLKAGQEILWIAKLNKNGEKIVEIRKSEENE